MSLPRSALFACALAGALVGCHRRDRDHRAMPSAKPVETEASREGPPGDQPSTGAMDRSGKMGEPTAPGDTSPPAANPDPWDQSPEQATPESQDESAPPSGEPTPNSGINEDQFPDGGAQVPSRMY